jgi:hypothetical protein
MAVSALFRFSSTLSEELASPFQGSNSLNYTVPELSVALDGVSTPVVDTVYSGLFTLTTGALTIDLTSLARTGRAALSLTGKAIYAVRIQNLGANSMAFIQGATNGYAMFALTPGHQVGAGGSFMQYQAAGFGTVGAADLNLDITGTGSQTFRMALAAGTP